MKYPEIKSNTVMIGSTPINCVSPPIGEDCPACHGDGECYTECCSGYKCSCRGEVLYLGECPSCEGTGKVLSTYKPGAHFELIGSQINEHGRIGAYSG